MEGLDRLCSEAQTDTRRTPEGSNALPIDTDAWNRPLTWAFDGGRYWTRTSDLCLVRADQTTSPTREESLSEPLTRRFHAHAFSAFLAISHPCVGLVCGVGGRPATPSRCPVAPPGSGPSPEANCPISATPCPSDDIGARYAEVLERLERGEEPYAATL